MTPFDFARALLSRLGLPVSDNNVSALIAVQQIEGGDSANSAWHNPLNTMRDMPGARDAGLQVKGIKAYANWSDGIEATARTLEQGTKTHVAPGFDMSGIYRSLARNALPDETIKAWQVSPWGWDKTARVASASAYQAYALRPFRSLGGGSWIDTGENAIRELFSPRPAVKYGMIAFVGVMSLAGLALAAYGITKHREA